MGNNMERELLSMRMGYKRLVDGTMARESNGFNSKIAITNNAL